MSKAKITPAPWVLRGWSIKHPGNGFRICVVDQPDKALKQFGDYEEMLDECKANAELIAMAPMLAHANVQQAEEIKALRSQVADMTDIRYDALRAAAGKVQCFHCGNLISEAWTRLGPCPSCADLRKLLGEKP